MITGAKDAIRSQFQPFQPDTPPAALCSYVFLRVYGVLTDFADAVEDKKWDVAETLCKEFQVIAEYLAAYLKMKARKPGHKEK